MLQYQLIDNEVVVAESLKGCIDYFKQHGSEPWGCELVLQSADYFVALDAHTCHQFLSDCTQLIAKELKNDLLQIFSDSKS